MSDLHPTPRITNAVWTCLKSGALYGVVVAVAGRELVDLGWTDAVCFLGLPAAVAAALVVADRLDRLARRGAAEPCAPVADAEPVTS